ncbi:MULTISPECIES: DNA cytosine methyltransferase [unclassified Streptomyces]|uniref:DNA cytosine methyltransferase n=1 Tax=unclassified Streptomyces TaxID=2593676 RepID=UPI0022B6D7E6|nr:MULTISPECIES: DNA (cytosine-5-)-methyltransferase [unclassified Streptomyces]MCZ7417514.1 DNA (cytosine-5-)-methyltransferase [Streptomyces sp. WMMC897]MCZ7432657.1 DNA (cytosine-5-)-methyltransferase [Streptomyces sp. WMMC1477]
MTSTERGFTSVEICAGAGGQALGLHQAGFEHLALIEIDRHACETLKLNVTEEAGWGQCEVLERDLTEFNPEELGLFEGQLDLLAGGVPCPPFSAAGHQLGRDDERDLFPRMLDLVDFLKPRAVLIENVRGLLDEKFADYRENEILPRLQESGYEICGWDLMEARDYGVPQLRPRAILVAMQPQFAGHFAWPDPREVRIRTLAEALAPSMAARFGETERGKAAYQRWLGKAEGGIAPTLVGGSKKHGGADLGPTRAKKAWRKLGVDAMGVANEPDKMVDPERDLYPRDKEGQEIGPKLTVTQAAIIQGFPEHWRFSGGKTAAYRQVGNAFPPPVARVIGEHIIAALEKGMVNPSPGMPQARCPESAALFELPDDSGLPGAELGHGVEDLESACVR